MISRLVEKMYLSTKGLLRNVKKVFRRVSEPTVGKQRGEKKIKIEDCLMSALAIFKLKLPSLLQFEKVKIEESEGTNLLKFGINLEEFSFVEEHHVQKKNKHHVFKFINKIPLNDSHDDFEVNFMGLKHQFFYLTHLKDNA